MLDQNDCTKPFPIPKIKYVQLNFFQFIDLSLGLSDLMAEYSQCLKKDFIPDSLSMLIDDCQRALAREVRQ